MIDRSEVTGVILAGGKSTRMRKDKAFLAHADATFLQRAVDVLRQVFTRVMIMSDSCEGYGNVAVPIFPDISFCGSGLLAGIHPALSHASTGYVFVLPVDTPFMSSDLVGEILRRATPGEVSTASDGVDLHPVVGVYPTSLLPVLDLELRAGRRLS